MKKIIKYGILIFLFSVLVGYFIGKFYPLIMGATSKTIIENVVGNVPEVGVSGEVIIKTANLEEKLLPTATLILEKKFEDCKHTIVTESELPIEMANLTKDEITEIYSEWAVKDFSKDSITLYKVEKGLCGEHFVINSENGVVMVYKLDENYDKTLYEKTDIYTEYLSEDDINKLSMGIYVYGLSDLNSILENFE